MHKTFKFKAKLSQQTEQNALHWLSLCQKLYNVALEQRINAYKRCGGSLSTFSQVNELPELKKEFPEFKQVGSQTLQESIERLGKAFQGFFRRLKKTGEKAGFPRFKSIHRYHSFTLKQTGWKLNGRHLKIKGVGIFKLYLSQEIQGNIKTVTIRKDACGDWWVCFSCSDVPKRRCPQPRAERVGIDVGLQHFATDTEGRKVSNPRHYQKAQSELRRKQRKVARRQKGSHRRKKAVQTLARAHRKVARMRLDFLHKTANDYINNFQTICIEALTVKDMVQNLSLRKSITDASWSTFFELLSYLCPSGYKAEDAGRALVKVNPRNTSQNCSGCGQTVKKPLTVRQHQCPHCHLTLDRDLNAAINIAARGGGQLLQMLT